MKSSKIEVDIVSDTDILLMLLLLIIIMMMMIILLLVLLHIVRTILVGFLLCY